MDAPEVEPPTLPPELDTALGGNRSVFRANGVQVVLTAVPAYWTLPVDAVVLPGDPTLSLGGEVGRAFDRQTGSGLLERLDSRIRETFKPGELIASNPIVLDRPEEMSDAIPAPTVVIVTACSSATSTTGDLDGLVAAVRALVHLATERTYRSIALPLLGTGGGGLDDKPSVLRTIAEELLMGLEDAPGITAVVAVPDESLINTEVSASWARSSDTEGGPATKAGGISLDDIETLLDNAETAKAAPIGSEAAEAKTEAMTEAEAGAAAEAEEEPDTDTPEPTTPLPPPPDRPTYSNDHLGRVSLARDDRLDIAPYVRSFARLIAARGVAAPLALGVFGHWGAGKSFFMRALDGEIAALAAEAAATAAEAGDADRGPWHDRIVPIWFNAWHYVDRNLWATLALAVFEAVTRELARGRTAEALRADLQGAAPSTREVKDLAEKRLGAAEQARVEAEDRLTTLTARRRAAEYRQLDTTLADADAETLLEETRAALDAIGLDGAADTVEAVHRLRDRLIDAKGRWAGLRGALGRSFASPGGTVLVVAGAVVVLAAGAGLAGLLDRWGGLTAAVGAVGPALVAGLAWVGRAAGRVETATTAVVRLSAAVDKALAAGAEADPHTQELDRIDAEIVSARAAIEAADREVAEARAEIGRIEAGGLVYDFLEARRHDPRYLDSLGLVSTVRRDFERLSELLEGWRGAADGRPTIDRIVLFIDDLDRCPPDRVVEVLEAIHLLLALDLFVVVVGVDARWLERALYARYGDRPDDGIPEAIGMVFSPHQYLEKIFQIPFVLPAMTETGFETLVRSLVAPAGPGAPGAAAADDPATPDPTGETAPSDSPPADTAPAGAAASDPAPDAAPEGRAPAPADDRGPPADEAAGVPVAVAPTGETAADSAARQAREAAALDLLDHELAMIGRMHGFVPTPRLAKRLVNVYRLIRVQAAATEADFAALADPAAGSYREVLVLLAVTVGEPEAGADLLRLIDAEDGDHDGDGDDLARLADRLEAAAGASWAPTAPEPERRRLAERLRALMPDLDGRSAVARYRPHVAAVGRFSYHYQRHRAAAPAIG